jgi:signal transduction histidine kinase
MGLFDKNNIKNSRKNENSDKPRILVVDDEGKQVEALVNLLSDEYHVITAKDGLDALALIQQRDHPERINVILSDQRMPGLTGLGLFERLHITLPDTIKIILTAYEDLPVIFKSIKETKIYKFITKPYDPQDLLIQVRNAVEVFKLRMENKNKDLFLYMIAHDLRGPMQSLSLATHILKNNFDSFQREKIKHYIHELHESTSATTELLENLLQWAMLQRGTIQCKPVTINLSDLTIQAIKPLEEAAKQKKIKLSRAGVNTNTFAFADKNMITTVIRNLVSNAIKFIQPNEDGGVNISAITKKDFIEISISDNGIGMAPETLDNIFQTNIKSTRKGTSGEKGTGLGLTLCIGFIKKNGGEFGVTSQLGKGTNVKFTLPGFPANN